MSKRRRRRRGSSRQGLAKLRERGHQAALRGDYDQAIEDWESLKQQEDDMCSDSALAEVYFRRGLERSYGKKTDLDGGRQDLARALELQPDSLRYRYHLGLAAHRDGDFETAIRHYKRVRQYDDDLADRAAYPLALALRQAGEKPSEEEVWDDLSDTNRALLDAAATFSRRPYDPPENAPAILHALAALDKGEAEEARELLQPLTSGHPLTVGIAHYYLGVLAAQDEDWDETRKYWNAAAANGYRTPYFIDNMGELYHRLAETRLDDGDVEGAYVAAQEAYRHTPDDNRLGILLAQINERFGYQAAQSSKWEQAYDHWAQAREYDSGSFRLAYNQALACEKMEDFLEAGELWRETLRRRPRRDDHPDAIDDEQVSKLWRRAAEAYVKIGEFDEAIQVYKTAVKWNPDSLDTRMALVEGLLNNGQLTAATNELERILDKDPDYIPALLMMAEALANDAWWRTSGAVQYWERVLELDPHNVEAHQGLINYYLDQANNALYWRQSDRALENYRAILDIDPENALANAYIARVHLFHHNPQAAQPYLDKAKQYGKGDLHTYEALIQTWIDLEEPDEAWDLIQELESQAANIPAAYYMSLGIYAAEIDVDIAKPWFDRVLEVDTSGEFNVSTLGSMLALSPASELAEGYLLRAVEEGIDVGNSYVMLAMLALRREDRHAARQYLREAEKEVRRTHDKILGERVHMLRDMLNAPPGFASMLFSPAGLASLLESGPILDDLDDNEEWYDDGLPDFFGY